MAASILIADDDAVQRRLVENMVQKCGYEAVVVDSGDAAIAMLTGPDAPVIDAMVLDLVMPGLDGMGVLAKIREAGLNIPVIVQTAHGGIDNVVSAMRAGAQDFVVKPVGMERLQVSLRNALNTQALKGELQRIRHSREGRLSFADIVTRSEAMANVLRTAQKATGSAIPVLIEGKSGVGKELFARAIHGSGERRAKPFVAVNCGAIPDNLVESILFGHEKGAFTGATERHTGKFVEAARRHAVPRRGLRIAAGRPGEAVAGAAGRRGGSRRRPQAGKGRRAHRFGDQPQAARPRQRRALSRGSVLSPARAAADDPTAARSARRYPAFVAAFPRPLQRRGKSQHHRHQRRGDGAFSQLEWPGNIRQLENAVYRAVVMSDSDQLGLMDFPIAAGPSSVIAEASSEPLVVSPPMQHGAPALVSGNEIPIAPMPTNGILSMLTSSGEIRPLEEMENEIIRFAISHYRGQMSEVARRLKIGRSTLYRKLDDASANGSDDEG